MQFVAAQQRAPVYDQSDSNPGPGGMHDERLQSAAQPQSTKMSLSKQNGKSKRNADFKHKFIRQTANTSNLVDSKKFKDYEKSLFNKTNHTVGPGAIARRKHEQDLLNKYSNANSRVNLMEEPTPQEFGLQINSARRQVRPKERYSKAEENVELFLPAVKGQLSAQNTHRDAANESEFNNRVSIQQFEIGEEQVLRKGKQLSCDPASHRNQKQFAGNPQQAIIIEQLRQSITNGSIIEYADVRKHSDAAQNEPAASRETSVLKLSQRVGSRLCDSTECTDEPANKKSGHGRHDISPQNDSTQQRQANTSCLSKKKVRNELLSVKHKTSCFPEYNIKNDPLEITP